MSRFVIGPDVALELAAPGGGVAAGHHLLAPTLLRSQVLSLAYQQVREGALTRREAQRRLDAVRALNIRLLGDRVLQSTAWKVAEQLGWPDTMTAEYLALTQLQADAFVTGDAELAAAAATVVTVAPVSALALPAVQG